MTVMENILGTYFRKRRIEMGLTVHQLVVLMKPNPIPATKHRLEQRVGNLECDSHAREGFLRWVAATLGIDDVTLARLIEEETAFQAEQYRKELEEWNRWADEPFKPYGVLHGLAVIYCPIDIPECLSQEEAERFVSAKARKSGFMCFLVWSRRITVFFNGDGGVYERRDNTPKKQWVPYHLVGKKKPKPPENDPPNPREA